MRAAAGKLRASGTSRHWLWHGDNWPWLQVQPHVAATCIQGIRLIVTLECTEAKATGATPSRYTTQKVRLWSMTVTMQTWDFWGASRNAIFLNVQNRKNTPDRLELMKYNPNLKR